MYLDYFGLTAKPFQITPDPTFYYASKGHSRALAYLEYGLHQREGFIVITGDIGAGKTTLLRGLLRSLDRESIVAAQIVSTQLEANDLIRTIAEAFGVGRVDAPKSDLIVGLQTLFANLHLQGKRALLVIDEAQNLPPSAVEELRMLSNFQSDSGSLLQSFLVGQPEFRLMMQRREMIQLRQRIIASYHLGPLDQADTRGYVLHRLARVGWSDNPHFDDQAFERIFHHSEGVPRRINTLCDRLMLWTFLGERQSIGPDDVDHVAAEFATELIGPQSALNERTYVESAPLSVSNSGSLEAVAESHERRLLELQDRLRALEKDFDGQQRALRRVLAILANQDNPGQFETAASIE